MRALSVLLRKARTLFNERLPSIARSLQIEAYSFFLWICLFRRYRRRLSLSNNDPVATDLLHFLTLGRVKFYDLLPVYTHLLNRHLNPSWRHTFISDRIDQRCPSALVNNRPFRWLMLDILDLHVHSKYVVLLHLDYFLMAPVNQELINRERQTETSSGIECPSHPFHSQIVDLISK